jgi:hypothetical protein
MFFFRNRRRLVRIKVYVTYSLFSGAAILLLFSFFLELLNFLSRYFGFR